MKTEETHAHFSTFSERKLSFPLDKKLYMPLRAWLVLAVPVYCFRLPVASSIHLPYYVVDRGKVTTKMHIFCANSVMTTEIESAKH